MRKKVYFNRIRAHPQKNKKQKKITLIAAGREEGNLTLGQEFTCNLLKGLQTI